MHNLNVHLVSGVVIEEASAGDAAAAARRLEALETILLVELTDDVTSFAEKLVEGGVIPEHKAEDALHVAAAVVHGMDYLLTWNLSHIAKAEARNRIERACRYHRIRTADHLHPRRTAGEVGLWRTWKRERIQS